VDLCVRVRIFEESKLSHMDFDNYRERESEKKKERKRERDILEVEQNYRKYIYASSTMKADATRFCE